jgi:DNA replication licensing factor MCM5
VPYLRVLGVRHDESSSTRNISFTNDEVTAFKRLAQTPNVYDKLASSIAPAIFGHEGGGSL